MGNGLVVTRGEGERERGEIDEVNGVKYVVTERNLTMGGEDIVCVLKCIAENGFC